MRLPLAALLLLATPPQDPAPDKPYEDRLAIDSVTEDFQKRWEKAETEKDWPELLKLFDGAVERFPHRLAQPEPDVRRWLRLPAVLNDRLAAILPESAREDREIVAEQLLGTIQDREGRARVIEKYGYTRAGRRAIEQAANFDYDEGRLRDAIRGWSRAMEARLSPDLVARLAHAHAAAGDFGALEALRAQAEHVGCKGEVSVGGTRRELHDFLALLLSSSGTLAPPDPKVPLPLAHPLASFRPSTEVSLGTYDLKGDQGALGRRDGGSREWIMRPAIVRSDGHDRAIVTNGLRVIAFDAAAAEGGSLENAVEWRYPKEGTVRYWMPTISTVYGGTLPQVGVTVAEGRAFATMFSAQSRQAQVGRRPDRFDGPGAIRALDLATGALLWDTDTLEVDAADGSHKRLLDDFPFGRLNFCFAGPPVVRGDRLYAAAMTMTPERTCYIVCLEPATGGLRWCRWVGSAPAMRERSSVPAFTEEEGTILVSTNFGILAALDSETGAIDWLAKYETQGNRPFTNPPIFHHSLVYVLAQDSDRPLVYDRWTGRQAEMPELKGGLLYLCGDHREVSSTVPGECPQCKQKLERPWREVTRLVGRAGRRMIFTGATNWAVDTDSGTVVRLGESDLPRPPAGSLVEGFLYLPSRTLLNVYDTATGEKRESLPWQGGEDTGQLVVSESLCAYMSDKLELFTSLPALKERFTAKVDASPPRAEPCRQLARLLEGSGRTKESVLYYRRALSVWEKDPAWHDRTEEMRKKLADLEEKLGDDFPKP
jgi:hypothetical protein